MVNCPNCDNSGSIAVEVTITGIGCCGSFNRDGSCCGNGVPVPEVGYELQQCEFCHTNKDSVFYQKNIAGEPQ